MKPVIKITVISLSVLFLAAVAFTANAATCSKSVADCTDLTQPCFVCPPAAQGPFSTVGSIVKVVNQFLFYFSGVFWIAAVGFVFYAAYLYLTAAGNEERVKKAKNQLLYAVIAMVIGAVAAGLPYLINYVLCTWGGGSMATNGICTPPT